MASPEWLTDNETTRSDQRAIEVSRGGYDHPILALQQQVGNAAVTHWLTQRAGEQHSSEAVGGSALGGSAPGDTSLELDIADAPPAHPDMRIQGGREGGTQSGASIPAGVQRAPKTAAPISAKPARSPDDARRDFSDFLNGIHNLTEAADPRTHGAPIANVSFGGYISNDHLLLLEQLRTTLTLVYDIKPYAGAEALTTWESTEKDLFAGLRQAPQYVDGNVDAVQKDLTYINDQLVRPAAYWDAHRRGLGDSPLVAPDLAHLQGQFDQHVQELKEAHSLAKDVGKIAGAGISLAIMGDTKGAEIYELVSLPGEIGEKLEKAKKQNIVSQTATAVELVTAIAKAKTFVLETTFDYLKDRAASMAAKAATKELAEHWTSLAEGYEQYARGLKTVGTVLGLMAAAVDLVKAFDSAVHGDWDEALKHAAEAGVGVLSTLAEASAVPLIGAMVILIKLELGAIHMAAEFIRWCEDETVREAAQSFISDCVRVAKYPAADMLADIEAYFDPANASIQDIIARKLTQRAPDMTQGLKLLKSNLECGEPSCMGGHGDLVGALGNDAFQAILGLSFPDDPFSMAQQMQAIFAGANKMAKYVHEHYPTDSEKRFKESQKKKSAEEE